MADCAAGGHAAAALSGRWPPPAGQMCLDSMPRRSRGRELVAVNFPSRLPLQCGHEWMPVLVKAHVLLGLFLPFCRLFYLGVKSELSWRKKSYLSFFFLSFLYVLYKLKKEWGKYLAFGSACRSNVFLTLVILGAFFLKKVCGLTTHAYGQCYSISHASILKTYTFPPIWNDIFYFRY